MFEELYLSRRPRASNDLSHGTYRYSRDEALGMRFIESSPATYRNLLVVDVDVEEADRHIGNLVADDIIPQPHLVTINPNTSHGQFAYWIEGAAGTPKGMEYFEAIRKGLTVASGGDLAYGGRMMRNPLVHPSTRLTAPPVAMSTLRSFADIAPKRRRRTEEPVINGRNDALFYGVREYAYSAWMKAKGNQGWFDETVLRYAMEMNCTYEQPLPHREVQSTVKSITKWVWEKFSAPKLSSIQSFRSKIRWEKTAVEREENKALLWSLHHDDGMTVKEIAEISGKTYQATKSMLRRMKEDKLRALDTE